MTGMIIELLTNLFQGIMFTGFLYFYFDKSEKKLPRILPFFGSVFALFVICSFFTLSGMHTGVECYFIDSVLCISAMLAYSLIFLKGKLYLRIIMPLFSFGINALVSYTFSYIVPLISGVPLEEFFTVSTYARYFAIAVVNLTTALLLWLVLRLSPKNILLSSKVETVAFAVIPVLCMVILYCCMFIIQLANYSETIMIYLLIICISMVLIAALIGILLVRISKVNAVKTELLLTSQREKLYEQSTLATNSRIEKISRVKHDIKNKISTLEKLIENESYGDALNLCRETTLGLNTEYTPIYSDNPVLNAIVNVELEKASFCGIDFSADIANTLEFLSSSDTVSLIGNLCDNAIEYLMTQPESSRQMALKIHTHLNFCIVTCKNKTDGNVLKSNPRLVTGKADKDSHGRGLSILKRIAKAYDGDLVIKEEKGFLSVSAILSTKTN